MTVDEGRETSAVFAILEEAPTRVVPATARLRFDVDAERLARDVDVLTGADWRAQPPHDPDDPNDPYHPDWKVLTLRAPGGDRRRIDPGGPGLAPFEYTELARETPYVVELLESLPTDCRSVRLMSLAPGARVNEHTDTPSGFPHGFLRLHAPVVTTEGAVLVVDGEPTTWQPGTLWYGDFARPHSLRNSGTRRRVHLIIDCDVTPGVLALFPVEFRQRLPMASVLFARHPVPLWPFELARFECRFAIPDAFLDWGSGRGLSGGAARVGTIRAADGTLVLSVDGEPWAALVHIGAGEFRCEGWTEERTLQVDARPGGSVRFSVRTGSAREDVVVPVDPISG